MVPGDYNIVRVDSRVEYEFGPGAKSALEAQGLRMINEHRHRDRHINKVTRFEVVGVVKFIHPRNALCSILSTSL